MEHKQIVVTLHGIRTDGAWQKAATPHLAHEGLIPYHIHFGWFGVVRFLLPWTRNGQIERVRNELRELLVTAGIRRLSVIAHSFGTYIALEALRRENGQLNFDRVVLTGCILPTDYPWQDMINAKRVMAVRNDRATQDFVVRLAHWASCRPLRWLTRLNAGKAGAEKFSQNLPEVIDFSIEAGHSGTHNALQYQCWARFVAYPRLSGETFQRLQAHLQFVRQEAARILEHPADQVRVNLFAPMGGLLSIVPGMHDNMTYAPEFGLRIETGHGGTGNAFVSNSPVVVLRAGNGWTHNLPGDQLAKIEPRLRWVVSFPVKSKDRDIMIGVVNVDGLDSTPAKLSDTSTDLWKATVLGLQGIVLPRVVQCLDVAFRGELLDSLEA